MLWTFMVQEIFMLEPGSRQEYIQVMELTHTLQSQGKGTKK